MNTIAWIPRSDAAIYGNKQITALYACAHAPLDINPPETQKESPKTNHWTLLCVLSDNTSVRTDPTPAGPNMSIVVMLSAVNGVVACDVVRTVQIPTTDLTINDLLHYIKSAGLDQYQCTANGQGCRYWISCVVKMLRSHDVLHTDEAVGKVIEDVAMTWASKDELAPALRQSGVQEGKFYSIAQ